MRKIAASDLMYIAEAAKCLKQKRFALYLGVYVVGLDNLKTYYCQIVLDGAMMQRPNHEFMAFNTKDLSDFMKAPVLDSEYVINDDGTIVNSIGDVLTIVNEPWIWPLVKSKFYTYIMLGNTRQLTFSSDINEIADELRSMHKADGAILKNVNGYIMTLFPNLLPMLKTDKLSVKIYDDNSGIFVAVFTIKKKSFNMECCVAYLNPMHPV